MKHLKLFEDFNEEAALNPVEITDFSMESGESDDICSNCANCECTSSEEEGNFEDNFEGNFDEENRHVSSFNQFESN